MIVLIPHIVRRQEITAENLKGILVGNQTSVKINYGPKPDDSPKSSPPMAQAPAAVAPPAAPVTVPQNAPSAAAPAPVPTAPAQTPAPAVASPGLTPPVTAPPLPGVAPPAAAPGPPGADTSSLDRRPMMVAFAPGQVEVNQGASFTVSLSVNSGTDVSAAPMQVQFDPRALALNDVTRGGFLSSDGQNPSFTKNVMNEQGMATIQLNRPPGVPGVSGAGSLVTFTFQAIARGTTIVTIPNLVVRDSKGAALVTTMPQLSVNIK
jgi:general secretion pathway protein D